MANSVARIGRVVLILAASCGGGAAQLPQAERNYQGREPDAAWRDAAAARINKHRKAELRIHVTDANGAVVPDANVRVRMRRHAFGFGAAVTARMLSIQNEDGDRFRAIVARHFNKVVLENDLTVMGPVRAVLYGLSSALDTDWVVRLCDVWPDGRSLSVCDGILRARYRSSMEHTELMTPDQVYCFDVDLWSTAQVFQAGHRLRVQVTSSDFPRYDRNLNTGGPIGKEVRGQVADNTVFHDALRPSHLVLPLVDTPA